MWENNQQTIKDLKQIIEVLEELGIKPFLWAGTLLGAVREGSFIKADDDIDLAYISNYSEPRDVMEEVLTLYKVLEERGLLKKYFDWGFGGILDGVKDNAFGQAHVKIGEQGITDLFTLWKKDRRLFDPWFGNIGKADDFVYKPDAVELDGVKFPGLENPEPMLKVLYGDDWRTPRQEKGTKRNHFRHTLKEEINRTVI